MLTTALCLNPSIDRTVRVADFSVGGTNRILSECSVGSGKGVNVAVAARRLGMEAACVGLLAQGQGDLILERLARDGVEARFVRVPGAVRVNLKILDMGRRSVTELNEPGGAVTVEPLEKVRAEALRLAAQSDYLVLTGSLPPGCPEDFYPSLMAGIPASCRCVVDVSGDKLAGSLRARPFLIKPNHRELEQAGGRALSTLRDVRDAAFALIGAGAELVAVSMGAEGAMLTDGKLALFAPAVPVPVHSTVGAGDSMVAGMIKGLREGGGLEHALRCGMAAATATVTDPSDGLMRREAFDGIYRRVRVEAI